MRVERVILCLAALFSFACATTEKPYLYGEKSCPKEGETFKVPYPTSNGRAVICMEKKRAEYMLCVRELGLASSESSRELSGSLKVEVSGVAPEASAKLVDSLKQSYEKEGKVAEARAKAIEACLTFLDDDSSSQ